MLAHLGFNVNWVGFSELIIPQLKGIYRYYQAQNAVMLQKLFMFTKKLNEANICPLLIKGSAMRLFFASGVSRMMADVDLAFQGDEYEKALSIVQEMDAEFINEAKYSMTYKLEQTKMDLHHFIYKNHLEQGSDIWKKVEQIEVNGCHFHILSPIDMFVHLLDTQSRCIFTNEMPNRRMKWLYDARMVLDIMPSIDWEAIAKRASELHCTYRIHLMMKLFATCYPDLISIEEVKRLFKVDNGYEKWLKNASAYYDMLVSFTKQRGTKNDNSYTLSDIMLRVKHQYLWRWYKYESYELKKVRSGISFARFVAEHYHFNRPDLLYQKFLSRIRFR